MSDYEKFIVILTFSSPKQTEHSLKKEKDAKAKLDKEKRKVEGDLKDTREKLGETESSLKEARDTVAK